MKDNKFAKSRLWSLGVHSPRGMTSKPPYKVALVVMLGLFVLVFLRSPTSVSDLPPAHVDVDELVEIRAYEKAVAANSATLLSQRNASFSFYPKISNLDAQRRSWKKLNANVRARRPKMLLVTGSQPHPCHRSIDTHVFLKTAKNKIHYCRLHDIPMHYSMVEPDSELTGSWVKLPVLRMLMLAHPEVEWFWWVDSEAVFTEMDAELEVEKYQGYNFVIQGNKHRVMDVKDAKGLMTSNFLVRNCQWSLHFLDAWASMGPVHTRESVGKFLSDSLQSRPHGVEADDQSALVYLLATETKLWAPKVYLENEFSFTGVWVEVTERLEPGAQKQAGEPRLPLVTHFGGCSQCSGNTMAWPWEQCKQELERTMDFADNQVYRRYGYQLRSLGSAEMVPLPGHELEPVVAAPSGTQGDYRGIPIYKLPGPKVTDWDLQRKTWLKNNPAVSKTNDHGLPKMMIVTGSSPRECIRSEAEHLLLKALKNKVDYARFHDMEMFYGMADFDPELNDWWTKIPTIRMLMLTRPDVEWFWWCDGDAIITDMVFEFPFSKYKNHNLVLYGDMDLVYNRHDWIGINAGVYLVRNCQWSLDLFDVWASFGPKAFRIESGKIMSKVLVGREQAEGDDQSALLYLLITDEDKRWTPRVFLERSITISGYWKIITNRFEEMKKISHPGLGNMDWPWITHFAGCQPCGSKEGYFNLDECIHEMDRSFDFGENQILEIYGLEHSPLGTVEVQRLKAV